MLFIVWMCIFACIFCYCCRRKPGHVIRSSRERANHQIISTVSRTDRTSSLGVNSRTFQTHRFGRLPAKTPVVPTQLHTSSLQYMQHYSRNQQTQLYGSRPPNPPAYDQIDPPTYDEAMATKDGSAKVNHFDNSLNRSQS